MYLWKENLLVEDFKKRKVSEGEKFKYFFVQMILFLLFFEVIIYTTEEFNIITFTRSALYFVGTLVGY